MKNDQEKVFVFDKLEIGILIIFFVVLGATSFVLGTRFGKKEALKSYNNSLKVNQKIALKNSITQRNLNDEVRMTLGQRLRTKEKKAPLIKKAQDSFINKNNIKTQEAFNDLKNEVEKMAQPVKEVEVTDPGKEIIFADKAEVAKIKNDSVADIVKDRIDNEIEPNDEEAYSFATEDLIGKYTIQVGSYKTLEEAQHFSQSFSAKNFKPIINEVNLSGRGKWYRVSLGVFDSQVSAIRYVKRESSVFSDQKYYITMIE